MGCKIENIQDPNLEALVKQYGAKDGLIRYLNNETGDQFDIEEQAFPFVKTSIDRISSGEKSITIRSKNLKSGVYNIGNKSFKIDQQGLFTLEEYLDLTGLTKEEFRHEFAQSEDLKEDHIKKFFDGGHNLFIYKITPLEAHDVESQGSSIEKEIKRLKDLGNLLERTIRTNTDQDKKDYYRQRLKRNKEFIKFLETPENQEVASIIRLISAELDQAENLMENGNTNLARYYINFFGDLIPEETASNELNEEIEFLKRRIDSIQKRALEQDKVIISNQSNSDDLLDSKGKIIPFIKDHKISSMLYDAAVSKNPWVREMYRVVSVAINKYTNKKAAINQDIKKLAKKVKDFQSLPEEQRWDFMLQIDDKGNRTGNTVDKYNWKYYQDRKENYANSESSNKELNNYLNWLKDNHTLEINREVFEEYRQSRIDYINGLNIQVDESKYSSQEAIDADIEFKKAAIIGSTLSKIDPYTFERILNKKNRTSKELDFVKKYLDSSVWKSYKGKPIINYEVSNDQYLDPKYQEIEKMDESNPLKQWYSYYTNSVKAARMEANNWEQDNHLSLNFIPEMKMEASLFNKLPDWLKESFTELPEYPSGYLKDPITGEPLMVIHDANMLGGHLRPEYKNYNLDKVLSRFLDGHFSKKYKSEAEDPARSILNIIKNQEEYELDTLGNVIMENGHPGIKKGEDKSSFNVAKYHLEALIYDNRELKEGSLDKKYYDSVTQKEIDDLRAIDERTEQQEERLQQLLKQFTVATTKKGINSLITYTAIKSLAFNPFSGIAEFLQSTLTLFVESAGNKFFSQRDMLQGYGKALGLINPANIILPTLITDPLTPNKVKNEADKWFTNFPIINNYGIETTGLANKMFIGFETSEKLSKGALLFAYLKNKPVFDKEGKKYKLLDVLQFNDKGIAYLDDRFEDNFNIESKLRNEVMSELSSLSKKLLSRNNATDPIQLNKNFIGRLLGQFRSSWMFEGFLRRWGKEYQDAILGTQKGYYRSLIWKDDKVDIKNAIRLLWKAQTDSKSLSQELSEIDVQNVRKSLRELQVWTTLLTMYLTLSLLSGDDEEEDYLALASNFMINLSYRGNRDLSFYINPKSTLEIFDSPAAAAGTVKQLLQFGQAIVETPFDPYVYENTKKEKLKLINSGYKLVPFVSGGASAWKKVIE